MQIQVNTDDNVEGHEGLVQWIETGVHHHLDRFSEYITRVEVHLSDEDSKKSGGSDKRCLIEARLSGRQPVAVSHQAGSFHEAFNGATDKLKRSLDSSLGRVKDHHGHDSIRSHDSADASPSEPAPPAASDKRGGA